jgi:hypothetical protein
MRFILCHVRSGASGARRSPGGLHGRLGESRVCAASLRGAFAVVAIAQRNSSMRQQVRIVGLIAGSRA